MTDAEAAGFFRASHGAPMCARFGTVLGRPGLKKAQEARIAEAVGSACDSHGAERPTAPPARPDTTVAIPDPSLLVEYAGRTATPEERNAVSSCLSCKHFVKPEAVMDEFGWPHGLCSAWGQLVPRHRLTQDAKNCDRRAPGENRRSTSGIYLKPIYEDAFNMDADPIKVLLKQMRDGGAIVPDPRTHPTDKPVSADDAADGVASWRKVTDPNGSGRFTYLPIFRDDYFTDEERAKIPRAADDEHPAEYFDYSGVVYKVAVLWMELDETPQLWGIAGTGKTELFRHLAYLMNVPFDRISITESTEIDDIAGKFVAEIDPATSQVETKFIYGRIPKRWTKPGVLLLDESNTGPEAVWQFIRPLTDNSKQLVLDINRGEKIARHAYCFFGMACNPAWDVRNIGARPISDADGNRLMHISMHLPPADLERAILERRLIADGWDDEASRRESLDLVMELAEDIRMLTDDGALPISWGLRPQIKVARAMRWFDPLTAYRLAVADNLEPEQATLVVRAVKSYIGDDDENEPF
jgi:MoxR-like ATPase